MLNSIQLLRIIAALLVFCAHIPKWAFPLSNEFNCSRNSLICGASGVDIFFCISGFLMYVTTLKKTHGFRTSSAFLARRIFRIWPLYILATVAYFSYWQVPIESYIRPLSFMPIPQDVGFRDPPISAGWTLNFEMYFYMITAALLLTQWKVKGAAAAVLALGLIGIISSNIIYFTASIIIEFAFGILIGIIYSNKIIWNNIKLYRRPLILGAVLLFICSIHGTDWPKDPGPSVARMDVLIYYGDLALPRFLGWGFPAFLLVLSVMLFEEKISDSTAFLGDYTYAFYLLHLPAAWWLEVYSKTLEKTTYDFMYSSGGFFVVLTMSLVIMSVASFHLVERPFQLLGGKIARRIEVRSKSGMLKASV